MATENSIAEGYVTEKIYDSFMSRTIPIYLGTNDVINDFNNDAFINVNDYKTFDDLIARIKEIDENDDLYMQMINMQHLQNKCGYSDLFNKLSTFLCNIIEHGTIRQHKYGRIGIKLARHEF